MKQIAVIATVLALMPIFASADSRVLWEGGLWNLDYPGDTSTYGSFRLTVEPDLEFEGDRILRVEWIEIIDGKGERVYASRLIPELNAFLGTGTMKVEMGTIPSALKLLNAKGETMWLRLWEPARYAVQESLD